MAALGGGRAIGSRPHLLPSPLPFFTSSSLGRGWTSNEREEEEEEEQEKSRMQLQQRHKKGLSTEKRNKTLFLSALVWESLCCDARRDLAGSFPPELAASSPFLSFVEAEEEGSLFAGLALPVRSVEYVQGVP